MGFKSCNFSLSYYACSLFVIIFAVKVDCQAFSTTEFPLFQNESTTLGLNNMTTGTPQNLVNTTTPGVISRTSPPPQKPPPALGLACNDSSVCKANFSSCVQNICTCQAGYISSMDNLICLKVASKLGESCSEDNQCGEGLIKTFGLTTCLNFICSCAIGMSLVGDKCQGPIVLNSNCSSDDDCHIKRSHCEENMCICRNGFVPNSENNACLPVNIRFMKEEATKPGCAEDIQCQDTMGVNAICAIHSDGSSCECIPGTHKFQSSCIPFKDLGDNCSYDEECKAKDVNIESDSSRICNQLKCSCNSGWKQVNDICTGGGASQITLGGVLITVISFMWFMQGQ